MLAGDTNGREESSEQRANHRVWNRLWQLRVPSKIKVFGWRACLNILPSKVNLVRRQILKEDRCGLCQRCPESVIHALLEYRSVKEDFPQLFQFMMSKLLEEELDAFLVKVEK